MDRWQAYLPVSSASLLPTFESAVRRKAQFSPAERALFMACEFWTAVQARTLVAHVGSGAVETLQYMSILYAAFGAHAAANEMIVAVGESAGAADPQAQRQCIGKLQENLLRTHEPVDLLIARLAERLGLGSGGGLNWECASEEISLFA
jgi:hypothetical protein